MNNETMLSVSLKAFSDSKKDDLPFEDIFQYVRSFFFEKWDNENTENLSEKQLLEKKRGELYKLLTIDGNFHRLADGRWSIIRPN